MNVVNKPMTPEHIQRSYEKGQLTQADAEKLLLQYYSVAADAPLSQNQQGIWSRQALFPRIPFTMWLLPALSGIISTNTASVARVSGF
ncbi:hypothetical protein [Ensifer canadensis]|uniref:hypothetical protein n=1 Tax=Ensifer canadensis TaxID=555315 RepID=UPI0035E3D956